jgi:hypothetical protein
VIDPNPLFTRVPGQWDSLTIETPSFVYGYDPVQEKWESRIYYTGYKDMGWLSGEGPIMIGYLRWNDTLSVWERHGNPVLVGSRRWEKWNGYSFVLDPTVQYKDGVWHLWYVAGVPTSIGYATSTDGVNWTSRRVFLGPESNAFTPDVEAVDNHYELTVGSLFHTNPMDGIWWAQSQTANGNEGKWTDWTQLISSFDGTPWHNRKVLGPDQKIEGDARYIFFRAEDTINTDQKSHIGRIECPIALISPTPTPTLTPTPTPEPSITPTPTPTPKLDFCDRFPDHKKCQ